MAELASEQGGGESRSPTARTALLSLFVSGLLGGLTSNGIEHLFWKSQHRVEQRDNWCEMTRSFESTITDAQGAEIFWGESVIFARLGSESPAAVDARYKEYLAAVAKNRIVGGLARAQASVYFGDRVATLLDLVGTDLDALEDDVDTHRTAKVITPAMFHEDSLRINGSPRGWPVEFSSDAFVRALVQARKRQCADD